MRIRPVFVAGVALWLAACATAPPEPAELEGDQPGECADAADNDADGLVDCDDDGCADAPDCAVNQPPSGPIVAIDPLVPTTSDSLVCSLQEPAVDPEGGEVQYAFAWTVDGEDAGIDGLVVDAERTRRDEVWTCRVTATDPEGASADETWAAVSIANTPPGPPELVLEPASPLVTEWLLCEVTDGADDADADPLVYDRQWFRNDEPFELDDDRVEAWLTEVGDTWRCQVAAWDGTAEGPAAEASVQVRIDISPHVAAGRDHSCSMQMDGTYACWGSDASGQSSGPPESFHLVAAGATTTCGSRFADTTVTCWGAVDHGQDAPPDGTFLDLDVAATHVCGVSSGNRLLAWGSATAWTQPPPEDRVTLGAASDDGCCGLRDDGSIVCFGQDTTEEPPEGAWSALDGGVDHWCALGGDGVTCWGDDSHGQVSGAPTGAFARVSAGWRHACAVEQEAGEVVCWGDDSFGQSSPPGGAFDHVSAGWYHTCGKRLDDSVVCWGCVGEDSGQCGPGL